MPTTWHLRECFATCGSHKLSIKLLLKCYLKLANKTVEVPHASERVWRKKEKRRSEKKHPSLMIQRCSMIKYAFDLAFDWHWCRYDTIKVCDLTCDHPIYLPMNRLFKSQKSTRTIRYEKKERQKINFIQLNWSHIARNYDFQIEVKRSVRIQDVFVRNSMYCSNQNKANKRILHRCAIRNTLLV